MPELDERKRIIEYNTVNDPDENYYVLVDNGTEGTGKANVKKIGPGNMISDAYSDQDTYAVGDVCIHNNILYVCNTEIDTPHAFDLSEWDPDTLGNYCSKLNGDVTEINQSLSNLIKSQAFSGNTNNDGNLVFSELSPSNIIAIGVVTNDTSRLWRFGVSGSGKLVINFNSTGNTALNNQPVSGTLYYIEP